MNPPTPAFRLPRLPATKFWCWTAAWLCLPVLFALTAGHAAGERFEVSQSVADLPDYGRETNLVVLMETSEVVLTPPAGSAVTTDPYARRIKLLARDQRSHIVVQFTTNTAALLSAAALPALRREVADRYAGARVNDGPVCYSGGGPGPSFDVEQNTAFGSSLTTRLAFVPVADGVVEISLTATTTNFPSQRYVFAGFLGSVRVKAPAPAAGRTYFGQ